jgi:alkylation response protein AidB-like acyl-CoA dehydrogenase
LKVPVDLSRETEFDQTLDLATFQRQKTAVAAALEQAMVSRNFSEFYNLFRSTDLPFIPAILEGDGREMFRRCFEIVHSLGSISPATALAVENHLYPFSSIATFPTSAGTVLDTKRRALISSIVDRSLLVANTNSKVHGNKLDQIGTRACREGSSFRITGKASYTSLSTQGDILLFTTVIENEGPALFVIDPMQGNPGVEIGPYLFPSAMIDSETRQITFHDLLLSEESLLIDNKIEDLGLVSRFEMVWHQGLIAALYLGAAARAIEEARKFLRSTRGRDDRPLAELDGMVIDIGRLVLDYRSAHSLALRTGDALGAIRRLPHDIPLVEEAMSQASAAKYVGTRCAENVVAAARRIIGARAFIGGHPLERLSQEVMFGPLGPEVSAVIERRFGQMALQERSFSE